MGRTFKDVAVAKAAGKPIRTDLALARRIARRDRCRPRQFR